MMNLASPEKAFFDYTVIRSSSSSPGDSAEVSVTVLPRTVVSTYVELFHAARIAPLSFELRAQAVCRAVIPQGGRGSYLVADVGEDKTGLFIASDGAVHFTAMIALGGAAIGKSLAGQPPHVDSVAALHAEIVKHLTYWRTHAGGAGGAESAVLKIVLCGRAAALPGFGESLSRLLALPVLVANVWCNVCSFDEYIPPILYEESLDYAAAAGAALPKSQ